MFPQFDPGKMDPQVLMQLSQLIQQLPPEQLNRMQTLMHNAMAGFDVRAQMEEFERNLPAGFREKLMALVAANPAAFAPMAGMGAGTGMSTGTPGAASTPAPAPAHEIPASQENMDLREARLTILRGVASGQVSPEEAEKLLFSA
jgi:hypothetical protein